MHSIFLELKLDREVTRLKNKKNMYTLAIVALILILGVGYAVVNSTNLTINGTAGAASTELKVVYDGNNSATTTKLTNVTAADDSKNATFTIADMVYNETIPVEFEIMNKEDDVDAVINYPSTFTNSNSTNFEVKLYYKACQKSDSCSYSEWTSGTKSLAAQAKATLKVEVRLKATPVTAQDSTTTVTVEYTAEPASA